MALPRAQRFTSRHFEKIRPRLRAFRSGDFLFLYRRQKYTKAAVVVSKKVEKSAVKRNQFRRRTYEIIRTRLLSDQSPLEVICLYRGQKLPASQTEIWQMMRKFVGFLRSKKI